MCDQSNLTAAERPGRNGARILQSTCPTCGVSIVFYASQVRRYCSAKCSGRANAGNLGRFRKPQLAPRACLACGKTIAAADHATRRYCSRRCFGAALAERTGERNPRFGRTVPIDKRKPITRVEKTCPTCRKIFAVKKSHAPRRRFCSRRCATPALAERWMADGNPYWRGGPAKRYYGMTWPAAQRAIRERDRVCVDCGLTPEQHGRALHVHHIVEFREFGVERHAEANALSNLVLLCNPCHKRRHRAIGIALTGAPSVR